MNIKNGLLCIPPKFSNYLTDRYMCLFNMLKSTFDINIIYSERPGVSINTNFIMTFSSPHHSHPNSMLNLLDTRKDIKIVGYMTDLHKCESDPCKTNMLRMLDRFDVIITPTKEAFETRWPQFMYKTIFFPQFFAPHERFVNLPFNNNPQMKCLLSGGVIPFYPIRMFINKYGDKSKINILPHPGYHPTKKEIIKRNLYINDKYAKLLNSYFACVATSSVANYVVGKYIEILASGSLLVANRVKDLDLMGFVPHEHYLPVTASKKSLEDIYYAINNPMEFVNIRKRGMKLVRNTCSINSRFDVIKKLLEDL